ncbi:Non-specific serine/threonine protein kinase [Mycena kentingensis (nom. inval.)]|nr:Non-specific serine/threonine protein kinase [Mycena kentingensis (nom. inval.)]
MSFARCPNRLRRAEQLLRRVHSDTGFHGLEEARRQTIHSVQEVVKRHYGAEYRVEIFGSLRSGLATSETTDIDMVILVGCPTNTGCGLTFSKDPTRPYGYSPDSGIFNVRRLPKIYNIKILAKLLRKYNFTVNKIVPKATVPIVKFRPLKRPFSVDLNVNDRLGIVNSDLIRRYTELNPCLVDIMRYVKAWAKPFGLNHPSPDRVGQPCTFSSYALTMMTIGFLQARHMQGLEPLPVGQLEGTFWLMRKDKSLVCCDTRYNRLEGWNAPPTPPIHHLVQQWLLLWGKEFDFSRMAVDVGTGGFSPRLAEDPDDAFVVRDPFIRNKNLTQQIVEYMSWKLGSKKTTKPENGVVSRSVTPIPSRPTTPKPNGNEFRNGMLTIRIFSGRGLALPADVSVPDSIQKALSSPQAARTPANNRGSMQRKRHLPYVVLEFDKNEILIDAMEGDLASPVWNYRAHFDVSRTSNVSVSAYLRTEAAVQGQEDMGNDFLMARVDLTPALDGPHASDEWYAATAGTGSFHLKIDFRPTRDEPLTIEAFELLKVIGKGSFGKVMQVRKKDTGRIYALKTIRKAHIAQRPGEITHILAERTVLALVNNPFIVPLKFSFQNPDKLYLVMSFVNGGELFYHLQREGKFDQERSRFYAAELLCALEHLHGFNVVYRHRPETRKHPTGFHRPHCLVRFWLVQIEHVGNGKDKQCVDSSMSSLGFDPLPLAFCGTPEYIAPELLESQGYTKTVDWWTLGVLLYEMMTGLPPFYDENVNTMYQRILTDPLNFPPEMSSEAKDVMTGLLRRDPSKRLGARGSEEIKKHPFFAKYIDWNRLLAKKYPTPFKPSVESVLDVANFDPDFTNEMPQDSVVADSALSETVQDQFRGFTYNPRELESASYTSGGL